MPDYTVSGDVDSMLRSANDAAIRSAIGVGTTDAPTFGPSLTLGTSGGTATTLNLGGPNYFVSLTRGATFATFGVGGDSRISMDPGAGAINLAGRTLINWTDTSATIGATTELSLAKDAAGILAQRNGVNAQAFRVYNTYPGTTANEWFEIDWKTTANTVQLGTNKGVTGTRRAMNFTIEGNAVFGFSNGSNSSGAWWSIATSGHILCNVDNQYDIGASGANRPKNIYAAATIQAASYQVTGSGIAALGHNGVAISLGDGGWATQHNGARFALGGTADTHPAIARDGAGIKITGAAAGSTSWIKVPAVAVSALPSAATAGVGARSFVNDALTPVFGSAVTGGGAVTVPVYSTGSAWNVG